MCGIHMYVFSQSSMLYKQLQITGTGSSVFSLAFSVEAERTIRSEPVFIPYNAQRCCFLWCWHKGTGPLKQTIS